MLDELELAIHFQWTSMHNALNYNIMRINYDSEGNLFMTLISGDLLTFYVGDVKWFEFITLVHSKNFTTPISHGIRGFINFTNLKWSWKKSLKNLNNVPCSSKAFSYFLRIFLI